MVLEHLAFHQKRVIEKFPKFSERNREIFQLIALSCTQKVADHSRAWSGSHIRKGRTRRSIQGILTIAGQDEIRDPAKTKTPAALSRRSCRCPACLFVLGKE
jgi:hypothetical protein